jgi:secreted trypsin-like serine protease
VASLTAGLCLAVLAELALLAPPAAQALDQFPPDAGASVVGGRPASIEAFPWLALVQQKNLRITRECTGTVVSPRVVLTAGHCVMSFDTGSTFAPDEYRVTTGVANRNDATGANVSQVSRVLAFPHLDLSTVHGDAGLLILKTPLSVPAIRMAHRDVDPLLPGSPVLVAGWGLTNGLGKNGAAVLQSAENVVRDTGFCKQRTRPYYPFFSPGGQFCAIDVPKLKATPCHGDSGGPVIARRADGSPLLVGITSLGDEFCDPRRPGIFTRVDLVAGWVDGWIAASEGRAPAPRIPSPPKARLPFLPRAIAKELAGIVLRQDFRRRYLFGNEKRFFCSRKNRSKVKCRVSWWLGPNDYWGAITIFLAFDENELVAGERYRIHRVNNHCWFDSGHRQSCVIHTRHG